MEPAVGSAAKEGKIHPFEPTASENEVDDEAPAEIATEIKSETGAEAPPPGEISPRQEE